MRALLPGLHVSAGDREDVIQDILLGAWEAIASGRYQPPDAVDPQEAFQRWLYGVTRHQCGHYIGAAWRRRALLTAEPYELAGAEPAAPSLEERVAGREALDAFNSIPEWAREVLVLRFVDEYDGPSIAAILGCKRSTAASRIRIARAYLMAELERRGRGRR
ncbi:MAG TPA: sigma-70 family RNA polymerase sigma factor [Candidatus Nanopelagicales bacterium]|nr:sigma-70 family RNA polymerase sigma factor [Candidatus Nanopelagicales bacterium]